MHPAEPGDTYLHDGISYILTCELRAIVTEPMDKGGRGGHGHHGQWWWANEVPTDVTIERRSIPPMISPNTQEVAGEALPPSTGSPLSNYQKPTE